MARKTATTRKKKPAQKAKTDAAWFVDARFGLFIHWGIYALAARHEWVKHNEETRDKDYQKYFDHFDPDLYDPKSWARAARQAGMRYFVITTKHHEGFCLWDSKHTKYKSTKTPYGKDLLKPMVKAFRDEGLRVGFYHSLIDWHHPEFPVDHVHPQRNNKVFRKQEAGRDVRKYARYLHNQVRELLTQFGKIDIMWFDFSYPGEDGKGRDDWQSEKLIKMVRELQPGIMVNNRLDLPGKPDIATPEQYVPPQGLVDVNGEPVVWEGCQTFSGSWGYHRDEASWKSIPMLVQMLIDHVSKGGNLLLNVGPTGRGEIDARALERLVGMGEWMRVHSRSIYGCTFARRLFRLPRIAVTHTIRQPTGSTSICLRGHSRTCTCPNSPRKSPMRSYSTTPARLCSGDRTSK
jgi:alpha-L-fucosidase